MSRKDSGASDVEGEGGLDALYLHVVRAGGFTAAAKALGRSTSSLSRAVLELERRLGAQLLVRTTRRLHLTEAGELYAAHAEALIAARAAARDAVAELMGGVPRGRLRVTMPVAVGERLLGPRLPELRVRYPELRLELDLSDRVVPLVEGGFDLAIRVGRLPDSSLRAQLLGRVPVRLVASPGYLERHGAPARPADVRDHPCIVVGALTGPVEWASGSAAAPSEWRSTGSCTRRAPRSRPTWRSRASGSCVSSSGSSGPSSREASS
ncbi:MAG: LysR family transcriptional regulator [Deltaproteobacteria bacterium]|nr:LysR family transcriptional regulator [Deltaproteobacteria bacterium]